MRKAAASTTASPPRSWLEEEGGLGAGVAQPAGGAGLDRRILEELIYERVRVAVDLCELVTFEEDLSTSISRALTRCARSPAERANLTLDYLHRAWDRVTDEVLGEAAVREAAVPRRD